MTTTTGFQRELSRDGTSQADRLLPALRPDYVAADERSIKDLLTFAREYAKELRYFDADDPTAQGDWHQFLDADVDLDEVVAFIQDPTKVPAERAQRYARPHFVLFLTFLQLLLTAQDQLKTLTRRHLDFYFQQALGMTKKAGVPDQVNVLVDLAASTDDFSLPAGTLLSAGVDSAGQTLFYSTQKDTLLNHAQVAQLSSLFADRRITGIPDAIHVSGLTHDEQYLLMFKIALGDPVVGQPVPDDRTPGDPLPPYSADLPVDYPFLVALKALVDFVPDQLFMSFAEFRNLMRLKHQRDDANPDWDTINALLTTAARNRTHVPDLTLNITNRRDFEANLEQAVGGKPNFDGITEVENLTELYEQRTRETVQTFIREKLFFNDVNDFYKMMQIKIRIDAEWLEINSLVEAAGQRKQQRNPPFSFPAAFDPTAFEANLATALGTLAYPSVPGQPAPITNLDQYDQQLTALEAYCFTSAENFSYVMDTAQADKPTQQQLDKTYTILADAHEQKIYAQRRRRLQEIREAADGGFDAMLAYALGDSQPESGVPALDRVIELLSSASDAAFLSGISDRVKKNETVNPEDWDKTYPIVERAQRAVLEKPVGEIVEWINLYPNADATSARVVSDLDADNQRWRTFGEEAPSIQGDPPPSSFGWALSSPILALSQGERTITLTLGFRPDEYDQEAVRVALAQPDSPFVVQVSTAKGWIEPDGVVIRQIDYFSLPGTVKDGDTTLPALQFTLTFDNKVAALTAFPDAQMASPWPILRLMLRQIWAADRYDAAVKRYVTRYQPFQDLALARTHLQVAVDGVIPAQLQNDDSALNPKKPFEPFGTNAIAGTHFYLSHPELVTKKLDSLSFGIEWMGVPEKLGDHYANYPGFDGATNQKFTARVSLIDETLELELDPSAALFEAPDARVPHTLSVSSVPQAVEAHQHGYVYDRASEVVTADDLLGWNRYVRWELNAPGFQQEVYPGLAAQKAVDLAVAVANKTPNLSAGDYQVNPPYTPKIKSLTLAYTSSLEVRTAAYRPGVGLDRVYQIQPFGYGEIQPDAATHQAPFLPQFPDEGTLYIGLQDLRPPQNLSLLFQMAEGSANPDLDPVPVQWSYLSDNQWVSLETGSLLDDGTHGLINSGIVLLALQPALPNTLLPSNLYWIRVSIRQNRESVCDTLAILAQAVSAVFTDRDNAPDHLSQPLPAKRITDLAETRPEISGVRQPYASFGGRSQEQDTTFYTRVSERLRHKNRALTLWDYEHMILEQFPQIYKAKCLPADSGSPGLVEIVVIPEISHNLPFNPFEPKAPADLIEQIETFLGESIPAYATVKVKNAHFIAVKVRFAVRFRSGYNEGFYKKQLNDDLNRFLSPWAYEDGQDIVIGGRIYANVIINFIEHRPYVDFVSHIKLFSSQGGDNFIPVVEAGTDGYWVETDPKGQDQVLVAAAQHVIDTILDAAAEDQNFQGINYMKIGLDFIVG